MTRVIPLALLALAACDQKPLDPGPTPSVPPVASAAATLPAPVPEPPRAALPSQEAPAPNKPEPPARLLGQTEKKEGQKIGFRIKEAPAAGKKGPAFRCEGEADLPEGSRIDVYYYFGEIRYGQEIHRGVALVKEGKFERDSGVFPQRTLPGEYGVRALFNPGLQPREELQELPRVHADLTFKVGTDVETEKCHNDVRKRMADHVEAVRAMGEEIAAKQKEAAGKLDKQGWANLIRGWRERIHQIELRAHQDRDFQILGLTPVADMGLEQMRNMVYGIADCAANGQDVELKSGLTRLNLTARKLTEMAGVQSEDPKKARLELAGEARKILREAGGLEGPALAAGRRKFVETLLRLNIHLPAAQRETVLAITSEAKAFFDAVADQKEEAKGLREKLDGQFEALLRALQEGK